MTESPEYRVIKKEGVIELRQYQGYIKAEVELEARSMQMAVYKGFNILAGYIFGGNTQAEKINMTSPVVAAQSEKIAMTKPVLASGKGTYTVAFIMPAGYSLETLPNPKDKAIRFVSIPPHQAAAIRTTGYFIEGKIKKAKQNLLEWVMKQGLQTEGDFTSAGYDPPWVPWFMKRNEVMIRIKTEDASGDGTNKI